MPLTDVDKLLGEPIQKDLETDSGIRTTLEAIFGICSGAYKYTTYLISAFNIILSTKSIYTSRPLGDSRCSLTHFLPSFSYPRFVRFLRSIFLLSLCMHAYVRNMLYTRELPCNFSPSFSFNHKVIEQVKSEHQIKTQEERRKKNEHWYFDLMFLFSQHIPNLGKPFY